MKKFSEADRQHILDQSRKILSCDLHSRDGEERGDRLNIAGCDPLADPPIETLNQKHRRELAERDEAWDRERRRERARDDLAVDHKIAIVRSELEQLRQHVIAIAKSARTGVERIDDAIHELQAKADAIDRVDRLFKRLEFKLDQALPRERGVAVDHLPNPLRSVN
jgi:hypothetical protein